MIALSVQAKLVIGAAVCLVAAVYGLVVILGSLDWDRCERHRRARRGGWIL